jgi:two-component system response regulator DegU
MKLMIVDDNAGVRRMIRQSVAASGDTVLECSSGDEAVRLASDFHPDFVTMDVRMPGLSGLDTTRAIRAKCPEARIVIVTNYDQPDLRRAATDSGAIGLVLKENLYEVRLLFLSHVAATATTVKPQAVPAADDSLLRVLMAEDSPLDCELICLRLTECGYTPVAERVCCEDEMRAALERSRWDIVFTDHGLPGFSGIAALELLRKMRLQTPALCVTGNADPVIIAQILAAGAFACISKNDLSTLCATVQRALSKGQTPADRPAIAPAPSSQAAHARNAPAPTVSQPDPDHKDKRELP